MTRRPGASASLGGLGRALSGLLAVCLALAGTPSPIAAGESTALPLPTPGEAPWQPLTFRSIPKPTAYSTRKGPGGGRILVAESDCGASGFVLQLDPPVDLRETPRLAWRWRITRPLGGDARRRDERRREGDDFAARVYVLFPFDPERASFLDRLRRSIGERWYGSQMPGATLTYVWPRAVARDTTWTSPFRDEVKLVAVEAPTKGDGATSWHEAIVNVGRDARLGLDLAPEVPVVGLGVMTDADDTCDVAGAEYTDFRWLGPARTARFAPPVGRNRDNPRKHELP